MPSEGNDMQRERDSRFERWAGLAFIASGLLMAALWIIYTTVHGPTSYDETQPVLGRSTLFWGMLLSALPNLLAALGLMFLYPLLVQGARRMAKAGYALSLAGLLIPAVIDLIIRALGPPFFVPVLGAGMILLALGSRSNPRLLPQSITLILLIGIFQLIAFALALIPLEISDQFGGYRIYGIFAHFLSGLGWAALGWTLHKKKAATPVEAA
jgi:hypothetical protein